MSQDIIEAVRGAEIAQRVGPNKILSKIAPWLQQGHINSGMTSEGQDLTDIVSPRSRKLCL